MTTKETAQKCKEILEKHYGLRLQGLVLYGSYARKQATPSSDIDLLVLLDKPFNYFQELREIIDLLYPLQLETESLISAKPAAVNEFKSGSIQLYRNVLYEGVTI